MSIIRLVLAWLLMAALPLPGIAAASMLFCGPSAAHSTATQPAQPSSHDHAAHAHDGSSATKAEQSAKLGIQQQADGSQDGAAMADEGRACPICASCCNLVALSEAPILSLAGDSPEAQPLQGPARVYTRHAPTPDKPPRA